MPGKFRISVDMDLGELAPEVMAQADVENAVTEVFTNGLLCNARARARDQLRAAQRDNALNTDVKTIKMGDALRVILLSLQAEANINVEALPDDAVIQTELPFEKRYAEAAAA